MPLKINLKANEKVIVNGAVLQNGAHPMSFAVVNEATILRDKDIMTEAECQTPARRIYYTLQCGYLFPAKKDIYLRAFYEFLSDFSAAVPSVRDLTSEIASEVEAGRLYPALRKARRLIEKEREILDVFANSSL